MITYADCKDGFYVIYAGVGSDASVSWWLVPGTYNEA